MSAKLYVVDQNVMQEEGRLVSNMLEVDSQVQFVVPDVAFEEMVRVPSWELTFRLSLALLAKHADRVRASISTYEGMNREFQSKQPITKGDLLATDFNNFFGPFLRELATGTDGPVVREFLAKTPAIRDEMLAEHLDPEAGKARMQLLANTWMQGQKSKELVVRLRKMPPGADREAFRLAVSKSIGDEVFLHFATNFLAMDPTEARALLQRRSITLRILYGGILDSLSWAKEGAIAQASTRTVNSRQFDMQYAVLATYFDGLLSNDKAAMKMYEDLRVLIMMADNPPGGPFHNNSSRDN